MFLLFIEQEIVYKDKEAGRRWKKHCMGVTTPNRGEQTTGKYNEEQGGGRITKQLHRPDEQRTPSMESGKRLRILNPILKRQSTGPGCPRNKFLCNLRRKEQRPEVPEDYKNLVYGGQIHFSYWSKKEGLKGETGYH